MNGSLRPLVIIIVVLAAVLYIGGILWAGVASLVGNAPTPPQIPDVITNIVSGIGALLATYFGAVFGITVPTKATSREGEAQSKVFRIPLSIFLPHTWNWRSVSPSAKATQANAASAPSGPFQFVQICACYAYFFSLLLAALFWLITGIKGDVPADVLKNMGSALFGVIIGVVSVVLNVRQTG